MSGGDDPSFANQSSSTRNPLGEKSLLDNGRLPRMVPKRRIVAAHDTRFAFENFATLGIG